MDNNHKILKNISRYIKELMQRCETLEKERDDLLSERIRLLKERTEYLKELDAYRQMDKKRELENSFLIFSDGDKVKAKKQIDRILREINQCIDTLKSK